MIGLQIDCQFQGAWCPQSEQMHLDGLLAKSAVYMAMARPCSEDATYDDFIHDLPLDRHTFDGGEYSGEWVWKASVMHVVGWQGQSRQYMTEKTPVNDMLLAIATGLVESKGGSTIDTQRGYAKNGSGFITIEHAFGLRAWCVGDPDGVAEYLDGITAVGVKTRIGLGTLKPFDDGRYFQVTPCEQAETLWMRRHTPQRLIAESHMISGSWKTPYWQGKAPCWAPKPTRLAAPPEISESNCKGATNLAQA